MLHSIPMRRLVIAAVAMLPPFFSLHNIFAQEVPKPTQASAKPFDERETALARRVLEALPSRFTFRHPWYLTWTVEEVRKRVRELNLDEKAVLQSTIALLKSPHPKERAAGVHLLRLLGDAQAIPPLLLVLEHDKNTEVRETACWILPHLSTKDTRIQGGFLKAMRKDQSHSVRKYACYGLGTFSNDQEAVKQLWMVFRNDAHNEVRVAAASALAVAGEKSPEFVIALRRELLAEEVREEGENLLEKIGKLELPLQEACYQPLTDEGLQKLLASVRSALKANTAEYKVTRTKIKDGKKYLEVLETRTMHHAFPPQEKRLWYVIDSPQAANKPKP